MPHRLHVQARGSSRLSVCLNAHCSGPYPLPGFGSLNARGNAVCPSCTHACLSVVRCDNCGTWAVAGVRDPGTGRLLPLYRKEDWESKTLKGKGVSLMEGKGGWHGKPLKKGEEFEKALAELQSQFVPEEGPAPRPS